MKLLTTMPHMDLASVDEGLAELDAGKGLDGDEVFRNLHAMLANLKR